MHLPIKTVCSEDTFLTNYYFIQRYIAHREPKPVDVFGNDVHASENIFQPGYLN